MVGLNVLTRISTKGAALARDLLCADNTVTRLKDMSRNAAEASAVGLRHREKVAVRATIASFR